MRVKAVVKSESGAVMLIVDEYESLEYAQADLELKGYRVYSLESLEHWHTVKKCRIRFQGG